MKNTLIKVGLLVLSSAVLSPTAMGQQTADKRYDFQISNPNSPVMLEVSLRHGKLQVQGGDYDKVELIARARPLDDNELAQVRERQKAYNWKPEDTAEKKPRSREGLTSVKNTMLNLQIQQHGNSIEIASDESTYSVELILKVPQTTNVEADLYRGDGIVIDNITGYLELGVWRGDIVAENIRGPIVAESHSSAIIVSFAEFSQTSPSSFTTHSGDIDITVANGMSANINVQNYKGEILSGLDVPFVATEQVKRREGQDSQSISIGGQLTASLNKGGQEVTISTYVGDVYVRKP